VLESFSFLVIVGFSSLGAGPYPDALRIGCRVEEVFQQRGINDAKNEWALIPGRLLRSEQLSRMPVLPTPFVRGLWKSL